MPQTKLLVVLDFDGLLINSYELLKDTLQEFGIDVGDEERFKKRRKFLKYFGGGKEILTNLVNFALPKKKRIREMLTEFYRSRGRIYPELQPLVNQLIANPAVHCGILSRNYTLSPGPTIRTVLRNSGVQEQELDFIIPIPVGVKKDDVLAALRSSRYQECILGGDEIGDYRAALAADFDSIIASYGFDNTKRLVDRGQVPLHCIVKTPAEFASELRNRSARYTGET